VQIGFNTFQVHLERGKYLLALGRVIDALREYRTTERLNPKNPIATFNCGLAFRKLQDLKSAGECYEKALRMDPAFDKAALELATLRATTGKLLSGRAARSIDRTPARLPRSAVTLAKTYIQLNQPSNAVATLERASDEDALARSLLGAAYLQQGNLDDAQRHLEFASERTDRSSMPESILRSSMRFAVTREKQSASVYPREPNWRKSLERKQTGPLKAYLNGLPGR
jgi:tetratricopeptide (TPR) repeat protein